MYTTQTQPRRSNVHPIKRKKLLLERYTEMNESDIISIPLKHFMIKFLAYSESIHSLKHTYAMKASFNQLLLKIGNVNMGDITKEMIRDYIEFRMRKISPYAVRRDLAAFSSSFKWAIKKKYMEENLTLGIDRPKIPERLPLFYTRDEFSKLLKVVDDQDLKDLIIFATYTGLRQSDIINLNWSQINLSECTLLLDNRISLTKSRRVHCLPLHEKAYQILIKRSISRNDDLVFKYKGQRILQDFISKKFKKFVIKAQLNPQLTFHKLRHTFATWLVKSGVPIYQVSKLMTHSDVKVTQIYSHLGTSDLTNAIRLLK